MQTITMRADFRLSDLTIAYDSREQLPYQFPGIKTVRATLDLFDYSVPGQESRIGVERKSLADFVASCGNGREVFERRLMRARSIESYLLVIEASWADLLNGEWRSQITPASVTGSTLGWMAAGIPILCAGNREAAESATARFLFCAARRRYRELRTLLNQSEQVSG